MSAPAFSENLPAAHFKQSTVFTALANCPGLHKIHRLAPTPLYFPSMQLTQDVPSEILWNLPATQSTQLVRAVAASSWTAPVTAFAAITTGVPLSSTITAAVVSNT
jgi:hypothetical protein